MKSILGQVVALLLCVAAVGTVLPGCAGTATRDSTGEFIDDATITTKVKAELVRDETVKARDVKVVTFRGVVQISGFVDTPAQKDRAELLAKGVAGVKSVENNIIVK